MIELHALTGTKFGELELRVAAGEAVAVFAGSEETNDDFIDTLTGFRKPLKGSVSLNGVDLQTLDEDTRFQPLARVAIVVKDGGLINNLKIGENILLPAAYHGVAPKDAEERIVAELEQLGFDEAGIARFTSSAPEGLPLFERRLAGLLRLRLLPAPVCIFDSIFDDLDADSARRLGGLVSAIHGEVPGRASLYTSAQARSVEQFAIQRIVRLSERRDK